MATGDVQIMEDFYGNQTVEPAPFYPQVKSYYEDNGNFKGVGVTFNQAYVINTMTTGEALVRNISAISNMGDEFLMLDDDYVKTWDFAIELIRNSATLDVVTATFTGLKSEEEGGETDLAAMVVKGWDGGGKYPRAVTQEEDDFTQWQAVMGQYQPNYTGYIPICQIAYGEIQNFTTRDNIHIGERQLKQMSASRAFGNNGGGSFNPPVDVTGSRSEGELHELWNWGNGQSQGEDSDRSEFSGWGGTGSAGVMSSVNWNEEQQAYYGTWNGTHDPDVQSPVTFRSVVGGSGISISPYRNAIVVDAFGGGTVSGWSGKCCGPNEEDTYCVYKEGDGTAAEGKKSYGTTQNPAIFRRISGQSGITVSFGDSADGNNENGDDCLIVIKGGGGVFTGWSGENCGRAEDGTDADWAVTQGINAAHSRAKNVYKAYTAAQDGTADNPAIFRRLSGEGARATASSKMADFTNGGVMVDYDSNDCLIGISGHLWEGINCGTDAHYVDKAYDVYLNTPDEQDGIHQNPAEFRRLSGDGGITIKYDPTDNCLISISGAAGGTVSGWSGICCGTEHDDTYCVYQDDHSGPEGKKSYGTTANPAVFRRLSGAGTVSIPDIFHDTDPWDACVITISGECCSGVENAGSAPDGTAIYQKGNGPALLRRLKGAGMLADAGGNSMIKIDSASDDRILVSGIWSGVNVDNTIGTAVYTQDKYDGTLANAAQFRTLKGEGGTTITDRPDVFGNPRYIEISGAKDPMRNTGDCGTYTADIYVENTGPDHDNTALFRRIAGGKNAPASLPVQGEITVFQNGDCVGVRGNGKDGSLTMASGIYVDMYDPAGDPVIGTTNTITLTWRDGLITTEGDFTQVYNVTPSE